jgi:hypothetical protein
MCTGILRVGDRIYRRDLALPGNAQPDWLERRVSPGMYFVFGSIALLFAASDLRMIVRGGVSGVKRVAGICGACTWLSDI